MYNENNRYNRELILPTSIKGGMACDLRFNEEKPYFQGAGSIMIGHPSHPAERKVSSLDDPITYPTLVLIINLLNEKSRKVIEVIDRSIRDEKHLFCHYVIGRELYKIGANPYRGWADEAITIGITEGLGGE